MTCLRGKTRHFPRGNPVKKFPNFSFCVYLPQAHDRSLHRAPLLFEHPQATTHMWKQRSRLCVPQLLRAAPFRPQCPVAADPAAHDAYARFIFGNFTPYRAAVQLRTVVAGELGHDCDRWLQQGRLPLDQAAQCSFCGHGSPFSTCLTRHMLHTALLRVTENVQLHTAAAARGVQRAHLREEAEAAGLQTADFFAPDVEADEEEDELAEQEDVEAAETEEEEGLAGTAADEAVASALAHLAEAAPDTGFVEAAAAPFSQHPPPLPSATAAPQAPDRHWRAPPSFAADMHAWEEAARDATTRHVPATTQRLVLDPGPPIAARVEVLDSVTGARLQSKATPAGELPPYIKTRVPPSVEETVALFAMSPDQARPFRQLATALLDPHAPQQRVYALGAPGCGKSHIVHALLWFAWQHDLSHTVALTSYTWRAALNVSTPSNVGCSTTTFFGVHADRVTQRTAGRTQSNLADIRLLVVDEVSFVSQAHFFAMHTATHMAITVTRGAPLQEDAIFGGLHVFVLGDFNQHPPVSGKPLFAGAAGTSGTTRGRRLWEQFDSVHELLTRHRLLDTPGAARLRHYTDVLMQAVPSLEDVTALLDDLNNTALDDEQITVLLRGPAPLRVVITRHSVRQRIGPLLRLHHAAALGMRPCVWSSRDTTPEYGEHLPDVVREALRHVAATDTNDVEAEGCFFQGARYIFIDNLLPGANRVRSGSCVGHSIVLDPAEPPDDGQGPVRRLKFLPRALFVVPEGNLPLETMHGVPRGCIPVLPTKTGTITVTLPMPIHNAQGDSVRTLLFHREGIPLGNGYAVTDYFVQGMSFKSDPWALHLNPPPTGKLTRASVVVPLTRYGSWDHVKLLQPLWPRGDAKARDRVIRRFHALLQSNDDFVAEMARLHELAAQTRARGVGEPPP